MVRKIVKNFLFFLFMMNATFSDAFLSDYEYKKNMPKYLSVYIDELAAQQIEQGLKTEETINEFCQEKENKYLSLLKTIKKNKNKTQVNFEFDKKFPKGNKGKLLNLVIVLLEAEELNEDGVNDFMQQRQDLVIAYREKKRQEYRKSNKCKESQQKHRQSDAYKESQKEYRQSKGYKDSQQKYRKSEKGRKTEKEYRQSDKYKESQKKSRQPDKCKESQQKHRQSDAYKESQKEYRQSKGYKEAQQKYRKSDKCKETRKRYYQRKKLLAQQMDKNERQQLLNKTQSLNDNKIQILIDASFEQNIECSFDIPTPQTPLAVQYLLDLYQNRKSSVSFDEAVEDAIYEDDSDDAECQEAILEDDMVLSENILSKRGKFECENNEPKRSKFE